VSDLVQQLDSELTKSNIELVHNAVDWSLADTDLLGIRSRNAAMRALTVNPDARAKWIWANGLIALAGLVLVVVLAWLRRRAVQPIVTAGEA
jgi:ABC-type Fe3+-siderophore transport system permease subunit